MYECDHAPFIYNYYFKEGLPWPYSNPGNHTDKTSKFLWEAVYGIDMPLKPLIWDCYTEHKTIQEDAT